MLLDLLADGLTAIEPKHQDQGSSAQSIVEILGARLVTNELFEDGPHENSHRNDKSNTVGAVPDEDLNISQEDLQAYIESQFYKSAFINPNTGNENQLLNCRQCN